jgi:glutamine amidotransferase
MKIVLIKYNAGNVQSVMYALERLNVDFELSDDHAVIQAADKIIFPGVGEASTAMKSLKENNLDKLIPTLKQPFFGTCVGMQLLCRYSEENNTKCLGVFDVDVLKFPNQKEFKVPQTGWNNITNYQSELTTDLPDNAYVYYNHSYFASLSPYTVATTDYILPYSAILKKDNFYAAQFHAEISGSVGHQILKNFIKL